MRYFVVRHKTTQQMLVSDGGASFWEPDTDPKVDHAKIAPRLFKNQHAAKSFISSWARGRVVKKRTAGDFMEDDFVENKIEPVPSRNKDQLEVVPCFLTFGEPFK